MAISPQGLCRCLAAALSFAVLSAPAVRAAEIETRGFRVFVDNKAAGVARMIIQHWDDGSISVRCDTDITVTIAGLIKAYSYSYHGHETWKAGRLLRLDSQTNDNGKHFRVSAVSERKGLRVSVNNTERLASADVWLTSYWHLPAAEKRGVEIPLIDADTGKDLSGTLQLLANEKRKIAGQEVSVNHYKLTGKVNIDLWYDGSDRLVRQEWVEDGHRASLELIQIER